MISRMWAAMVWLMHGRVPDPVGLLLWAVPLSAVVFAVGSVLWHYASAGARWFNVYVEREVAAAKARREIAHLEILHSLPDAAEPDYGPAPTSGCRPKPRRALLHRSIAGLGNRRRARSAEDRVTQAVPATDKQCDRLDAVEQIGRLPARTSRTRRQLRSAIRRARTRI